MSDAVFFYRPAGDQQAGDVVVLDGAEGRHAASVKRLRAGEAVILTDGHGASLRGQVTHVGRRDVTIVVEGVTTTPPPSRSVTVVQAVAKGDRGERAVELMTEVGVSRIVPWLAARSVSRWSGERAVKGLARWQGTAAAAAKQSRRVRWPEVIPAVDTVGVCEIIERAASAYVLHEGADRALTDALSRVRPPGAGDVVLVVGPEGGISPEELESLTVAGAAPVRLGPTVLRTSTAGVVAATLVLAGTDQWRTAMPSLDEGADRD